MFKQPRKSLSLQVLEILNKRKALSHSDMTKLQRLKKGYQGEVIFSNALKKYIDPTHHTLFDLNLTMGGSASQYDALLLMKDALLHFEVKNISGDYYIRDDNWYRLASNQQINQPTHQMTRANRLMINFLKQHQINLKVKSFTIFVHPQFHLYNAPIDRQIIFPSQIKNFLENLNQTAFKNYTHTDIYKLLVNSHIDKLPHEVLPDYSYDELKKGIFCEHCSHRIKVKNNIYVECSSCQYKFTVEEIIAKNTIEYSTLFPDESITAHKIYGWIDGFFNNRTITKHLKNLFIHVPNGKFSYYKLK